MRIALIEPDIAGNLGTILRFAACFNIAVDVIEPCGFPFSDKRLKRAGMDYAAQADVTRHADWDAFRTVSPGRLVLLTTKASTQYHEIEYFRDDVLLLGSEGAGAPDHAHAAADVRVRIPLRPGFRSLNVAVAAGIVAAEALRQTKGFPA
jgi:tRNA (cytidine/uridine-2'-O-)-methyltransferase